MRVGMIGTGAISRKHASAYRKIGYQVVACTNRSPVAGQAFAAQTGAEFVPTAEELCRRPDIDYVDVCTLPEYRLEAMELCARYRKHLLVQKPIATSLEVARRMIEMARGAGICLGVVSQHRFDEATLFLRKAISDGRLGKILEADAYVKWYRSPDYYSRPVKGSWLGEGGGALINQAIHQVDLLLALAGPVKEVFGYWQLGALHKIESEDVVNAMLQYSSGAIGVIQASTAFWPGYPERIEIHGTKGTAIITGDALTAWDVQEGSGEPAPLSRAIASGSSNPMEISTLPLERQFLDFGEACRNGGKPLVSAEDGFRALAVVTSTYQSCRIGQPVAIPVC